MENNKNIYIGFISYSFGEHYSWICNSWEEMVRYCNTNFHITIPFTSPFDENNEECFNYTEEIIDKSKYNKVEDEYLKKSTWINIRLANNYSINQITQCK